MKPGELQQIARKLLDATMHDRLRPTTRDIQKRYKLNEDQVKRVKQYAKAMAAQNGFIWGYDPETGYFRNAPYNTPDVAKRMLEYQLQHWKEAGRSTVHLFKGAQKQGYLSKRTSKNVKRIDQEFERELKIVEQEVKAL